MAPDVPRLPIEAFLPSGALAKGGASWVTYLPPMKIKYVIPAFPGMRECKEITA